MARTYTMTPAAIFAVVRRITQDERDDMGYRVSDAAMLAALNEAIRALVGLRPGLFAESVTHTCVAGTTQLLDVDRAVSIIDVHGLTPFDPSVLTSFAPAWRSAAAAAAQEWAPLPGQQLRFEVSPPSADGQSLTVRAAIAPAEIAAADEVLTIPEVYAPALAEYVAGRIDMADDEHANSNRAGMLLQRFAESVKAIPT